MEMTTRQPAPDTTGEDDWAHFLGHLLWDVAARATVLGEAELAGTPLTLPSSGMLQLIGSEPGITIAEIARRVPKTQQAISQIVARLEKLGYLVRQLGPGRGVGLYLTVEGLAARDEAAAAEARFDRRLRDLFGADRYTQLRGLLEEARERLSD